MSAIELLLFRGINRQRRSYILLDYEMDSLYYLVSMYAYHSRFIPEGVAETSQIFLRKIYKKT
jgi:hypothetical protein